MMNNQNKIPLKMSTGEVYYIDTDTYDWSALTGSWLEISDDNVNALVEIMQNLFSMPSLEKDECKSYISTTIENLTSFMDSLQIHPHYEDINPKMSDYNKAMYMVFDTMYTLYTMKIAAIKNNSNNDTTQTVSNYVPNNMTYEPKSYRVIMDLYNDPDRGCEVYACDETSFETPEGFTICEVRATDHDTTKATIIVCNCINPSEATTKAEKILRESI